ncbi:MAG: glycosyl hydrolase [Blastocatellia bacterium]
MEIGVQGISGVYESMMVAEQLSRSPRLADVDPDFGKSKQLVAAEMRDHMLQTLKELVGQWADVYTAQFFWYNTQYNSFFGFPQGFGSLQNFNDHHFHYGYFLRTAAAIGRYDKDWLTKYMPFIDQIRRDVATYDRSDTQYPFLREFSPFYGHNWADGTGADGNNQESVSEAMNFAYGMIELGQILGDSKLRDLGVYMFAEEELAAQQYWFNSDADLAKTHDLPYNGNWPEALVHYTGPDGQVWKTTLITNVKQFGIFRSTFFGGIGGVYTIQQTPMTAYALFFGRNQNWLQETWKQYLLDSGGAPQGPYEVIVSAIQAQLPQSGTNLTDVGLTPALKRIGQVHNFFPGSTNSMGKHWAYTLAQLGQIDFNVVADTTTYAVFNKNGQRTYTAYNPGDTDITVTFIDKTSGARTTLQVPARTMASKLPNGPNNMDNIDRIAPYTPDAQRLYLRGNNALSTTAGSWMPPEGQTSFPSDSSALAANLMQIPVRSDQAGGAPQQNSQTPISPPPASDIRTWTGTFSGKLASDPKQQVTRFSLYTNQSLFPGWQQDPSKAGNSVTVRFIYDFNSDGKPDRIEVLQNAPLSSGNAFLYESKLTEYTGDRLFNGPIGRGNVFIGGFNESGVIGYTDPYPSVVTNATLTVQFYGGSNPNTVLLHPYFVSQDASPLTNRASWVKPPYSVDPTQVEPGPAKPECATICFASPEYYLRNLHRLPRGTVLIAGGGIDPSVSTSNTNAMRLALDSGSSAQDQFNRQFVAAQLSLLAAPGPDQGALGSKLGCYGINFAPVTLGNGATLTPNATLGTLMEYARSAARRGSAGDLTALANLLAQLNAHCRRRNNKDYVYDYFRDLQAGSLRGTVECEVLPQRPVQAAPGGEATKRRRMESVE